MANGSHSPPCEPRRGRAIGSAFARFACSCATTVAGLRRGKAGIVLAGGTAMPARMLIVVAATAVLVGGAFVLRTSGPAESVQAVSLGQAPPPERQPASVSVVTEVLTAQTIAASHAAGRDSRAPLHARPAAAPKRSLLARMFLGTGE